MAAQHSSYDMTEFSSESQSHPDSSASTRVTPDRYLKLATLLLRQSQEMTSGNVPMPLQFNHRQCAYLVKKLETAVQSARDIMSLSSPENISVFMKNWKFLVGLALNVKVFIQECCEEKYWIQAASMLINTFERVASLSSDLELCIWSNRSRKKIILGTDLRRELTSICEAQDHRLCDQIELMKRVEVALQNLASISTPEEHLLAISLLGGLEAALAKNTVIPDQPDKLADLSFRDQVNLLKKVEAASSSDSISDPEEHELATSLVERYRVAVASPIPDKPIHSEFMRVHDSSACLNRDLENRFLGKGSFGEVHEVKWLGIRAAEKGLPEENEGKLHADFVQEVSILARLSHPSIVRLLCYVQDGVKCSILLELMDKDLTALIKERVELDEKSQPPRGSPFSTGEVVDIILQIAEGMEYLHRRRVLHRDLKSQNILVKREKLEEVDTELIHVKVADFGISKTKERSITFHHPTWNRGTTRWMAPELILLNQQQNAGNNDIINDGFAKYPFLSDVFSFGMVCYEILTGDIPFAGLIPNSVKKEVLKGKRPPLSSHCPSCLASMIKKCWRAEPKERPSFAEICRELRFMKGSLLIGRNL